jgi:sporulation protein YlmC with PRC-barrel domain
VFVRDRALLLGAAPAQLRLVGQLASARGLRFCFSFLTLSGFTQPLCFGASAASLDPLLLEAAHSRSTATDQQKREQDEGDDDQNDDQGGAHGGSMDLPGPFPIHAGCDPRRGSGVSASGSPRFDVARRPAEEKPVLGPDIRTALDWRGRSVVDRDGEEIGTLKEIYLDQDERPAWGSIHTGLFGLRQTLVPLTEVRLDGDRLRVPYEREQVRSAPTIDPDVQLTDDEEQQLFRHYGVDDEQDEEQATTADDPGAAETGAVAAPADSVPEGQTADDAMTRSEEEVRIGKRTRQRERVRLKKYVVTDYVEKKVPVKREEVRLEREPPRDEEQG